MRSYTVRLVLVLRCTFIYHHNLCLLIVVTLLSLCRCVGPFKPFLCARVKKSTANLVLISGHSAKGPDQPASHMRSLARAFTQRVKVSKANKPVHEISNNVVCVTNKASDQPAHTCRLFRAFASRLNIR